MDYTKPQVVEIKSNLTSISYEHFEFLTAELLNDCSETLKVCGYEMEAGDVLQKMDPVAFRQEVLACMDDSDRYVEIDDKSYYLCEVEDLLED